MASGHWSVYADRVLADLFRLGQAAPTRAQVRDAYPFGERKYWPYKAWCSRVKAWRRAHARGLMVVASRGRTERSDHETLDMFEQAVRS